MQIKIITVPILGGERENEELNQFLRSMKILQVENQLVIAGIGAHWSFCIKYLSLTSTDTFNPSKPKIDYRDELEAEAFQRFAKFREIRKKVCKDEAVPAYAIFTDEELAGLAKISDLTLANMKTVKGIGEKKAEKYGRFFVGDEV